MEGCFVKTILVDHDEITRNHFAALCHGVPEIELTGQFERSGDALAFAGHNRVELAVISTNLQDIDCVDLGIRLRLLQQGMVLIYLTDGAARVAESLHGRADYCIMKPFGRADILDMSERAKLLSYRQIRVRAVMFGRFQVFARDEVISFTNAKAKELLALCMDHRGGEVMMEEAIDKLWPDRVYDERVKKLYRKAVMNLQSTLRDSDAEDIFVTRRGACNVVTRLIDCDYYHYLEDKEANSELFDGEYLFDYAWGEETVARLTQGKEN